MMGRRTSSSAKRAASSRVPLCRMRNARASIARVADEDVRRPEVLA